jgi:aryl sulfotransferase
MKTHAARLGNAGARLHPEKVTRAAIYFVRDPRDVVVSYASHIVEDLDTVVGWLCDPEYTLAAPSGRRGPLIPEPLGTWSQHVISWIDADDPPAYVLRYEDMLADPLTPVAGAMECAGLRVDPARLRRATEAARFDVLSEAEGRVGYRPRGSAARFFRSGTAGGWRTALSADQASRIVAAHGQVMARLGYAAV